MNKYNIGDRIETKIHYKNDERTQVKATIIGVELESDMETLKYKISFEPTESDRELGCVGCEGHINQNDIIGYER